MQPPGEERSWTFGPEGVARLARQSAGVLGVGLLGFGGLAAALRPPYRVPLPSAPGEVPLFLLQLAGAAAAALALALLSMLLHEGCHGLAIRCMGARPRYGAKLLEGSCPVLFATAPGFWFTRGQYLLIALLPTFAVTALGVWSMLPPGPVRFVAVFPLAAHLSGCVGDWAAACAAAVLPRGTMIEDAEEGFRYRVPPGTGSG